MKTKNNLVLLIAMICSFSTNAQLVVSAPILEAQSSSNQVLQKIMQKIQNENLKTTIDIARDQKELKDYTKEFYEALKKVSNTITNSQYVKDCMELQKMYVTDHYNKIMQNGNQLQNTERDAYRRIMNAGLRSTFKTFSNLKIIISPNFYQMNDADRLAKIVEIKDQLNTMHKGMLAYNKEMESFISLRKINKRPTIKQKLGR